MRKLGTLLLMMISTAALCSGCGKPKINLNNFLTYQIDGYNNYGTVSVVFHESDLEAAVEEATGKTLDHAASDLLKEGISCDTFDHGDLKNGDTFTLIWSVDEEELESELGIDFTFDDKEETVSGLKEIATCNVFDGLKIQEFGVSGDGSIEIDDSKARIQGLEYTVIENYELSNGDEVEITIDAPDGEDLMTYCAERGALPKSATYTYTVKNLGEYMKTADQIPDSEVETMKSESADEIKSYLDFDSNDDESLVSITYSGAYVQHAKRKSYGETSRLYVVNKVVVKNTDETTTYYHYCSYANPIVYADGTLEIDYSNPSTPEGFVLLDDTVVQTKKKNFYYEGYKSLRAFEKEVLEAQIKNYSYTKK